MQRQESFALMKFRVGLILIALVFTAAAVNEARKAGIKADEKSNVIAEVAGAATPQTPSNLTANLEGPKYYPESFHFEPLLLLLLGSTLFCISSAIRLVLSRKPGGQSIKGKKPLTALSGTRRGGEHDKLQIQNL